MRTLVVYAHPCEESFTAAVRDRVLDNLRGRGHAVQLVDLHAEGFEARMSAGERASHHHPPADRGDVDRHAEQLRWAEAVVFVYPTWWSGQPAILKGWFDRVWTNGIAYRIDEGGGHPTPLLRNIRRLTAVTTHGSKKWVNVLEGEGGKRIMTRSIRSMCHPFTRTRWVALYDIDRSTPEQRERFLHRVGTTDLLR